MGSLDPTVLHVSSYSRAIMIGGAAVYGSVSDDFKTVNQPAFLCIMSEVDEFKQHFMLCMNKSVRETKRSVGFTRQY